MTETETDHEQILEFVQRCRDEHIAPYPIGTRVVGDHTGLGGAPRGLEGALCNRDGRLSQCMH
jgi:hypothetical protein